MPDKKNLIIIGGGIAGLTAAVELSKNDIPVTLIEASGHLGGRCFSQTDRKTGDSIDNGQHILAGAYRNFLALPDDLGTSELLYRLKPLKIPFFDLSGVKYYLDTSIFPGKAGMAAGLMRLKGISFKSKLNALKFVWSVRSGKIDSKGKSAIEILKGSGQANDIIERFWEPVIIATMNTLPERASAAIFATIINRLFLGDTSDSEMIIPKAGFSELLSPAENIIKNAGGEILLNTRVSSIGFANNRADKVIFSDGSELAADAVIAAMPPYALKKILPEKSEITKNLDKFRYSPIVSVYLWFGGKISLPPMSAVLGGTSQWIFNKAFTSIRNHETSEAFPGFLEATVSAADEIFKLKSSEIIERCLSDIKKIYPESAESKLLHSRLFKEQHATVIIDPETSELRPDSRTDIENLLLAGDWINTGLPATIESAAASGKKAAGEVYSIIFD